MTWYADQRQKFIVETLRELGFINRYHLMRHFRISQAQATNDLQRFIRERPGAMAYNLTTKRYEKAGVA